MYFFSTMFVAFIFFSSLSFAECTSPAGSASQTRYDTTDNIMYYCNNTDWVAMGAGQSDAAVPSGAVLSFDLAACPSGWSEYIPARGRFVRGIDPTGASDPDGVRTAGNVQADDFRAHSHHVPAFDVSNTAAFVINDSSGDQIVSSDNLPPSYGEFRTTRYSTASSGGTETRPVNVALLYCRKD